MGRRYSNSVKSEARELRSIGMTYSEIAQHMNMSYFTVKKWATSIELSNEQKSMIKSRTSARKGPEKKSKQQQQCFELRKQGMSINKIAKEVGVSQGSVSLWVRDIELTEEQKELLRSGNYFAGNKAMQVKYYDLRKSYQDIGREKIRNGASDLYKMACMLYWAEGGKKSKSELRFSNSDIDMVKLFVRFLIEEIGVNKENVTIRFNCYLNNGLTLETIENHWLKELGDLPRSCLRRSTIKYGNESKRKNRLQYGIAQMCVCDVKVVQEVFGAIQEIIGIGRPEWIGIVK